MALAKITDDDLRRCRLSGELFRILTTLRDNIEDQVSSKLDSAGKGSAGGFASLDVSGKIPDAQVPDAIDETRRLLRCLLSYLLTNGFDLPEPLLTEAMEPQP